MAERIKVIFKRVYVKDDADTFGSGEFYFIAHVDHQPVGNRNQIFEAIQNQYINLGWSKTIDVTGRNDFGIRFQGKDEDVFCDDDLGTFTHVFRRPFQQRRLMRLSNPYIVLEVEVQLEVGGTFAQHPPRAVFACRQNAGSITCTTVSGRSYRLRGEIHPVRPVPTVGLPPRPAFPAGTSPAWSMVGGGANVTSASPVNVITNPVVIPRLTAAAANANTCARIELTYYRPGNLAFTANDARLQWTAVSTGGGQVRFLGPAQGTRVQVYGTRDGAVRLDVSMEGARIASYRALVDNIRQIPCRFNILNGPNRGSQPVVSPADVLRHVAIANCFLRQIGLQMVYDTNATRTHGARATGNPGIFRIRVPAGRTRRVATTGFLTGTRLNYRQGVMNFAYIHSDRAGNLGAADDYPASNAGGTLTDSGTPSTSWTSPTGVPPDGAAGAVNLTLLAARQRNTARFPNLFCMYLTDGNYSRNGAGVIQALASDQTFAGTIAHELGHVLNLGHRVDAGGSPFNDGINYPTNENVMHFNNPTNLAQDFDYIQALAVRQSPLVPP